MKSSNKKSIKTEVKSTAKKAAFSPLMQTLARLGYAVRGIIYIILGSLAFSVSIGKGEGTLDQQGAIAAIGKQPAGSLLLWAVLIGLVSYAFWGLIRALFDPFNKGSKKKGLIARGGYLISAGAYGYLAFTTYQFIQKASLRVQSNVSTQQQSFAALMSTTLGPWLVGLIGLGLLAFGLSQVYTVIFLDFERQFKTYTMSPPEIKLATQIGRFGTGARGLVFALVAFIMIKAAIQTDPNQQQGVDAALTSLLRLPYGVWILAFVAIGLIAFGVYSILCALWFRTRKAS